MLSGLIAMAGLLTALINDCSRGHLVSSGLRDTQILLQLLYPLLEQFQLHARSARSMTPHGTMVAGCFASPA